MMTRKWRSWSVGVTAVGVPLVVWAVWPVLFLPRYPCTLPSLEATLPITAVETVGAGGRYQHTCAFPVVEEMLMDRPYGAIRLRWWGSPQRLYLLGTSTDGQSLGIRGARVEAFERNGPDSVLARYTNRVTFAEFHSLPGAAPLTSEAFRIDIYDGDQWLETVELRYVPTACQCVVSPW